MTQALAISKQLTTMAAVEERFHLSYAADPQFFREWREALPPLSESDRLTLTHIQERFLEHRHRGFLPEGTVDKLMISPLLDLAGLYEPRFTIRAEASVEILLQERDERLQGRIDTLILQDQLWVLVVEAKNTSLSLAVAVPQALTYMMGAPDSNQVVYGLVTNGDEYRFIKLDKSTVSNPQFDLSDLLSLFPPQRSKLQQVLQVLKQISDFLE